ncbi:hypothetical protein LguiA_024617 [Lonicera macranthoides]
MQQMDKSTTLLLSLVHVLLFSIVSANNHEHFLQCLFLRSQNSTSISAVIYNPKNSSYLSILQIPTETLRFTSPDTPRPLVIVTPLHESQIQTTIYCAKRHGMQIRIRSGGHDYEGLSFVSKVPFVILDLINYQSINIDGENGTAWVQAGSTIGSLYYRIAEKNRTLGFLAGICPTIGVGGHFSGGGFGALLRKYGLAVDNIIDACLIDVNRRILDRKSMGEDLFWAIRGGGGASFGVIIAWKIKLIPVPETVAVFTVDRTLQQNATKLIHKWQYVAPEFPQDLFVEILISRVNSTKDGKLMIRATFHSLFLGGAERLLSLMQESFPELGILKEDCIEMSWIEFVLYFDAFPRGESLDVLLDRTPYESTRHYKAKSDYVREPISEKGLEGMWNFFDEDEAEAAELILVPYGGRMSETSESAIPFPHRAGNLYKIQHLVYWDEEGKEASERHICWIRRLYGYMAPYVSKFPGAAYFNYRDLDLGVNENGAYTSYAGASIWGNKYFKNNFKKLARVKTKIDPDNFFRNEQSVPPFSSPWEIRERERECMGASVKGKVVIVEAEEVVAVMSMCE